jgi:DNA mismatch repair ATPase MutS
MAGKTTFIKTIGVNLILARTLWFCHAAQAQLPLMKVMSSIKTEDGLEEGKSFYFSELERLNTFLQATENGENYLFLIDEIYRGTNTVERVAGAAAVLEELASNNIVFVTTHDIELADYLNKQYDMWYFEETGRKAHPFDYKLRSGLCKTRNALKLMSNIGYPEHITQRAVELAQQIEHEG